ncbi:MAG: hypothetical protein HC848_06110 [Limnobacter sp.]|nr:hypothetical protein [Limnobacter sp.]
MKNQAGTAAQAARHKPKQQAFCFYIVLNNSHRPKFAGWTQYEEGQTEIPTQEYFQVLHTQNEKTTPQTLQSKKPTETTKTKPRAS